MTTEERIAYWISKRDFFSNTGRSQHVERATDKLTELGYVSPEEN